MSVASEDMREAIVQFISSRYAADGVPPTIREIAAGVGSFSTSPIYYHLAALVRDRRLEKRRRRYFPLATSGETRSLHRPVSSCPWGDTPHSYAESHREPVVYCQKCGDIVALSSEWMGPGILATLEVVE